MPLLSIIFSFLVILSSIISSAQVKTSRHETKEYYPWGELKKVVTTKIKKESDTGLFNNYLKTTTTITELYPGGLVQSTKKIVDKIGEAGGPCYHLKVIKKEFNEKGKICYYYRSRCDNKKSLYKVYNYNGKRLNKTVFRRSRWE